MPTGLGSRPTFSYSHPRSSRYISFTRHPAQCAFMKQSLRLAIFRGSAKLVRDSLLAAREGRADARAVQDVAIHLSVDQRVIQAFGAGRREISKRRNCRQLDIEGVYGENIVVAGRVVLRRRAGAVIACVTEIIADLSP